MNVYLVWHNVPYEGDRLIKIFSTEREADQFAEHKANYWVEEWPVHHE